MASGIRLKRINKVVVKPIKLLKEKDTRPVRGAELFPEVYSNICILAKKNSGKSNLVAKILKECVGPSTSVIFFSSTINKDPVWLAIRNWCVKKNTPMYCYTSLMQGKHNLLKMFVKKLGDRAEQRIAAESREMEEKNKPRKKIKTIKHSSSLMIDDSDDEEDRGIEDEEESEYDSEDEDDDMDDEGSENEDDDDFKEFSDLDEKKERKEKLRSPEFIIVLDDLSSELKNKELESFLKLQRHWKLKFLISNQYINDILPGALKQMDYFLLFKSLTDEKLKKVKEDGDLPVEFPVLKEMYEDATREDYNFLYTDNRGGKFRKNFNELYTFGKIPKTKTKPRLK